MITTAITATRLTRLLTALVIAIIVLVWTSPSTVAQFGFTRPQPLPYPDGPRTFSTATSTIRVVPMAAGLVNPWSLAFLPDGDILVTERSGRLRIVRDGVLDPATIDGVPEVWVNGQSGLMEVALHPRFTENQLLYLTYSKPAEEGAATALARGRFDGERLHDVEDLFVADNWETVGAHFGSKIAFGADGMLYMTVGERTDRDKAQDPSNHNGTILRLTEDGTVPPNNPFVGRSGFRPEIYSYGHRNPQGLAFHPETGDLWSSEHGPQGGDELNFIEPGKNYGWPIVTFGREYTGQVITDKPWREGIEQPDVFWVPSIGISGLTFYTGDQFPDWLGNALVGGLSGHNLERVGFTEEGPVGRESMLVPLRQRIRDVRQGPDGLIYLAVDGDSGGLLRVEPVADETDVG